MSAVVADSAFKHSLCFQVGCAITFRVLVYALMALKEYSLQGYGVRSRRANENNGRRSQSSDFRVISIPLNACFVLAIRILTTAHRVSGGSCWGNYILSAPVHTHSMCVH